MTYLKPNYTAHELFKINDKILAWDLTPLAGKGLVARFTGANAYAHIELNLQETESSSQSEVYWNMPEHQIPYNFGHKIFIQETLEFFTNYIAGIRGERLCIKYEITNIGYNAVDSKPRNYAEATMRALIDSFDNTIFSFNEALTKRMSAYTLDYVQRSKTLFLKIEIIESLKQSEIPPILSKIFDRENIDIRMLNEAFFNKYISDSFEIRKVLLSASDMDLLKKYKAITESEEITDIGKAHIAHLLNDLYDLYYHFNIRKEDIK